MSQLSMESGSDSDSDSADYAIGSDGDEDALAAPEVRHACMCVASELFIFTWSLTFFLASL